MWVIIADSVVANHSWGLDFHAIWVYGDLSRGAYAEACLESALFLAGTHLPVSRPSLGPGDVHVCHREDRIRDMHVASYCSFALACIGWPPWRASPQQESSTPGTSHPELD